MTSQIWYAVLASALLILLVGGLVLGSRRFFANRSKLGAQAKHWWRRLLATRTLERIRARYPRTWAFVAARFARGEYLGLHLTVGLAVSLAGLWIFAGVTEDVIHHDPLTEFDLTLLAWLQAHAGPTGKTIFGAITTFGSPLAMILLAGVVAILLAIQRRGLLLEGWLIAFLGGGVLNEALKRAIHRPRPPHSSVLSGQSWSFPSGHAMGSLIGYGMLAYVIIVLGTKDRRTRVAVILCTAVLVLAIGVSRLYLGVHYFSDVVGGYAAGALWLSACISGLEIARGWREPE